MQPRKLLWLSLLIVASLLVSAFLQFYVIPPQVAMASPDTVTYYFNAYGAEVWEASPASMTDGNLGTYASTNNAGEVQLNNANNCSGTGLGLISKVELRAYGYGDGGDFIYLRPVFTAGDGTNHQWTPGTSPPSWSPYYNITSDTNAPTSWNWSNVQELDVDVEYNGLAKPNPLYIAKVEIRVTYSPAPTVGTIAISPSSMTPQEQWTNITVPVTDNDTLADVNEVHVEVFYDSAGNDPSAPGMANVQTCAILIWTRGGSPEWDIAPASTTWAINAVGCSNGTDSLTTDNWVFSFKVGKVATQSPDSDDWDIYAKATDSVSQTGDNYLRDVEMNWYGEITVNTTSVDWGIVSPGCSNNISPVVNITYICNGNYIEQVETENAWNGTGANQTTLNTTGAPGPGEFSLKADDDATIEGAVQVLSASYTTFDTGIQTTETGNPENNNHLWLSLGDSNIPFDTYSGTIHFGIA